EGVSCTSGTCRCAAGQRVCASASGVESCVDPTSDADHCGACGQRCPAGATCVAGTCTCAAGRVVCPSDGARGTCVDITTSVLDCGACGSPCPATFDCVAGVCLCPSDRTLCGESTPAARCVDVTTDEGSCGACDRACAPGMICESGRCVGECAVGDVCTTSAECRSDPPAALPDTPGAFCSPEVRETVTVDGVTWDEIRDAGGYCLGDMGFASLGACELGSDDGCPSCAQCHLLGVDPTMGPLTACLQRCDLTSTGWATTRSGCRDGYRCDLAREVCVSGCTSDAQCRATWTDADGDGLHSDGETTYDASSSATCDPSTGTCTSLPFDPDARPGDPCTRDRDCGLLGTCLLGWPGGGYCTRLACTLDGRGCEPGSTCLPYYVHADGACLRACTLGDETEPSQILGAGGGDPDCGPGYACISLRGAASGGCTIGVFNDVTEPNVAEPCDTAADCYSPYGLGGCATTFGVRWCALAQCGAAPFGHDGGTRSTLCPEGTVCVGDPREYSQCLRSCDPALAGADCPASHVCHSMGDPRTPVCFPRCRGDGDCGGRDRCLEGICRRP
ncbi:MAG: hypothetical protein IT379_00990, partial [Deltaproteobacteria bacterium]|nr:hypothetical protein [Deltaproteobacteria bacterium]